MNNKNKKKQSLAQFVKYSVVGASNTLIEISILNILSYTTGITHGITLFFFNMIAFSIYSVCGYNLNKKFTFRETSPKGAYLQYASVLFFTMILNSLLLVLLTSRNPLIHLMHNHLIHNQRHIMNLNHLWLNISMIINSIVLGILGFLVNKFFIFNKKKTH
ncbi:GtrA family protein [Clostridium algoriphilum]|uniref:GtrA family protein n=1 Tax=Clostridium algoriphilum TaxID=198347 RepID=UPI001CF57FC4|nr:GtrA family protein [Clostridium algoriphilum]MCB2294255.1 GtrA family protein [Clostridium algoriphilum]